MSSLPALPIKLRGSPAVQGLMSRLQSKNARVNELKKLADQAQTPAGQTMATQGGAAAAAALFAFLSPDKAALGTAGLAAVAILAGSVYESPEAVSFGNGALAPVTFMKVNEFLTRQKQAA